MARSSHLTNLPLKKGLLQNAPKFYYKKWQKCVTKRGSFSMTSGGDSGLSTLCHSCELSCQQGVLKAFPGPGHILSEDGVI